MSCESTDLPPPPPPRDQPGMGSTSSSVGDGTDAEAPLSGAATPVSPAVPVVSSSSGWAIGCCLAGTGYTVPFAH